MGKTAKWTCNDEVKCSNRGDQCCATCDLREDCGSKKCKENPLYCNKSKVEDDQCQPCHNALQCLVWADEGMKAECDNWGYFEQNYVNGPKRDILAAELDEI